MVILKKLNSLQLNPLLTKCYSKNKIVPNFPNLKISMVNALPFFLLGGSMVILNKLNSL